MGSETLDPEEPGPSTPEGVNTNISLEPMGQHRGGGLLALLALLRVPTGAGGGLCDPLKRTGLVRSCRHMEVWPKVWFLL